MSPLFLLSFYSLFYLRLLSTLFRSYFWPSFPIRFLFPPRPSTSSIRLTVVLTADLSENQALIFPSPKLCPAKLTPFALTFC